MLRRTLLSLAPSVLMAQSARPWREVEKLLSAGNVEGRLSVDDLPTPALLVDLDALDANIAKMVAHTRAKSLTLRPHGKTHKCPEIARRLIAAGAVGACAAKLSEAEAFARGGVKGLLITGAVIGRHKIERAIDLARRQPDTIFCVDHAANVADLDAAAAAAKMRLHLAIDLYVGNRTGIATGAPALELARYIAQRKNVQFAGLQAYAGHAAHRTGFEARREFSQNIMRTATETARMLHADGIACPLVTGASTGTYNIDSEVKGVTELQPGSFIFMDLDYERIGGADGPLYRDFQYSLSVLTTVVSKPSAKEAVVDGGLKAFSTDKPFKPEARGIDGLVFSWGGDEHGKLDLTKASRDLNVGDRLAFVVPHCDPTVNLYDRIYGVRGKQVQLSWPIAARGMSQ
ncbi:MAG: DSD1 family PLP-dependent enzyme [Bryobacterales bacterium]|nr:DSD1 family PLP-dependent enzyme [Bryobacterales bacterium]